MCGFPGPSHGEMGRVFCVFGQALLISRYTASHLTQAVSLPCFDHTVCKRVAKQWQNPTISFQRTYIKTVEQWSELHSNALLCLFHVCGSISQLPPEFKFFLPDKCNETCEIFTKYCDAVFLSSSFSLFMQHEKKICGCESVEVFITVSRLAVSLGWVLTRRWCCALMARSQTLL